MWKSLLLVIGLLSGCGGGSGSIEVIVPPPKPITVVTMGDSITAGLIGIPGGNKWAPEENWVTELTKLDSSLVITNTAVPGNMITDVLTNQYPLAVAKKPDVVTIWVGVNDAGRMTPEQYQSNLDTTISMLKQQGIKVILISALWNGHIPQIDAVNQVQIDVAKFRNVKRVDLYPLMKPEWWCGWPDVHPCRVAHPVIAKEVYKLIKEQ